MEGPGKKKNMRKMTRTIFAREERLALEHLREDAAGTPDVHGNIVFLPCEHDLWCTVVSCRNVTSHLRILDTSKSEITDLEGCRHE
jgi:hypothetical protein